MTRKIPTLNGWTARLIKTRDALEITTQGFVHGQLDAPLYESHLHTCHAEALVAGPRVQDNLEPFTAQPHPRVGTPIVWARFCVMVVGWVPKLELKGHIMFPYGLGISRAWFANDFEIEITTAELLSVASQVVDMVRQHLNQAHEDPNFSRIAEVTKLLFGLTEDEQKGAYSTTADNPQTSVPTPTQHEEAFLAQPGEHIGLGAR
nr:hypothetical protein Iba_chr05bCG6360 [Ipomoea batatas]